MVLIFIILNMMLQIIVPARNPYNTIPNHHSMNLSPGLGWFTGSGEIISLKILLLGTEKQ